MKGIPKDSVQQYINDIISVASNPDNFSPTIYLAPKTFECDGKTIIHIPIPLSSEVYRFKGVVYDRTNDADVKVVSTDALTTMCIRKQKVHTERMVYPFVTDDDLRFDLFPKIVRMAVNHRPKHPWKDMSEKEIIKSAGLYSHDQETGKWGYNLAAVMLLGKDHVIKMICPTYCTDAILRKKNVDRFDDRLVVETNLIESYDLLMGFAEKHLLDKFHLEDGRSISLSGKISKEMLVNTLMHREFISPFVAKFVIEKDRMYVENANRAAGAGAITPDNFDPKPKNPIIAAFFRNIGYADSLGSGIRNLYKYVKLYSGKDPLLIEGDVFKIIVPLDDNYSYDVESFEKLTGKGNGTSDGGDADETSLLDDLTASELKVYKLIIGGAAMTTEDMAAVIGVTGRTIRRIISKLVAKGYIKRVGGDRDGRWVRDNR